MRAGLVVVLVAAIGCGGGSPSPDAGPGDSDGGAATLKACASDSDCAQGGVCNLYGGGVCMKQCSASSDCPAEEPHCSPNPAGTAVDVCQCQQTFGAGTCAVGKACAGGDDLCETECQGPSDCSWAPGRTCEMTLAVPVCVGPVFQNSAYCAGPGGQTLTGTLGFVSHGAQVQVKNTATNGQPSAVVVTVFQADQVCGADAGLCSGWYVDLWMFGSGGAALSAGQSFQYGSGGPPVDGDLFFPGDATDELFGAGLGTPTGTATLTTVGPNWSGTFSLTISDPNGNATGTLGGSFEATVCP